MLLSIIYLFWVPHLDRDVLFSTLVVVRTIVHGEDSIECKILHMNRVRLSAGRSAQRFRKGKKHFSDTEFLPVQVAFGLGVSNVPPTCLEGVVPASRCGAHQVPQPWPQRSSAHREPTPPPQDQHMRNIVRRSPLTNYPLASV